MINKKAENQKQKKEIDFLRTDVVVSSNECTGLIQTPPTTEEEAEAYEELYPIPKQVNNVKSKN